jgi:hypothetical protein
MKTKGGSDVSSLPTSNRNQRYDQEDYGQAQKNRQLKPLDRPIVTLWLVLPNPVKVSHQRTVSLTSD